MNNDLISRSALIKAIFEPCRSETETTNHFWYDENLIALIDNAPTVEKRPHGKWIFDKENSFTIDMFRCSICGYFGATHFNFCPNCGADMREEADNDKLA